MGCLRYPQPALHSLRYTKNSVCFALRPQALLANMKRMKAQPQHLIVSSSMHYYQEYSPTHPRLALPTRARAHAWKGRGRRAAPAAISGGRRATAFRPP